MKNKTIIKNLKNIRSLYNFDLESKRELGKKIGNMNLELYKLIEKLKKHEEKK